MGFLFLYGNILGLFVYHVLRCLTWIVGIGKRSLNNHSLNYARLFWIKINKNHIFAIKHFTTIVMTINVWLLAVMAMAQITFAVSAKNNNMFYKPWLCQCLSCVL